MQPRSQQLHVQLEALVRAQLPRGLQDVYSVGVTSDPFLLHATAAFKHASGRELSCELEATEIEGVPVRCRIPEAMLTRLCVEG